MGAVPVAVQGVRHAYAGGPPVLADADLQVAAGVRTAILGANGSGKSTLLRCVSGALRPQSGTVRVNGQQIVYSRSGMRRHRQAVQLVTQDPDDQLFSASVAADVSFGPVNLGLPEPQVRERVAEALDLLAITHLRGRPTHQLSFGERKRAAIAGAVAMRPSVLVLDEPTAGLDPAAVAETLSALDRLRRAGTTLVLATHDVDLAVAWADEVAVLLEGKVLQGDPRTVLGDGPLISRARLRTPWVLSVRHRLARLGVIPDDADARDEQSLLTLLDASLTPAARPGG